MHPGRPGLGRSVLLALPMALLTALLFFRGPAAADPFQGAARALVFAFFNAMFFLMLHTGKTDRWRAAGFIVYAVLFAVAFISRHIESRGTLVLTEAVWFKGGFPFCHILIPMTFLPAALKGLIIFPSTILGSPAAVASILLVWIGASLAIGRGWCGWGCFFGGLDDGFSRILDRPVIKGLSARWTDLPWAILLMAVLSSAVMLLPTYCMWACPFRVMAELDPPTTVGNVAQDAVFVMIFLAFIVVLPLLLKRRAQCAMLCPFGAFQSGANWINPFEVRIDAGTCTKCRRCVQACPTFSLTDEALAQGRSSATCLKCGKCVDLCPQGAARFHIKGTAPDAPPELARLLFLYPAAFLLAAMANGFAQDGLARLLRLAATGRMW